MLSVLSGCTNVVMPPAEQPTQYVYKCYTDPVPDGYLRVDSVDSSLPNCESSQGEFHVFKYAPFTNLGLNQKLEVCVDDDLTQAQAEGWTKLSSPYRDAGGCDALTPRFKNDSNYLNVLIIKKTSQP